MSKLHLHQNSLYAITTKVLTLDIVIGQSIPFYKLQALTRFQRTSIKSHIFSRAMTTMINKASNEVMHHQWINNAYLQLQNFKKQGHQNKQSSCVYDRKIINSRPKCQERFPDVKNLVLNYRTAIPTKTKQ